MNTYGEQEIPDLKRTRRRKDSAIDLSQVSRLPPFSLESEQGLLGSMLIDPVTVIPLAIERLKKPEMLYDLRHQTLFETLVQMDSDRIPVDVITVREALKNRGQLEACGGVAYLNSLVDCTPSSANAPFYADTIKEKHLLRRCIQTCSNLVGRIYEEENQGNVETLLDEVEKEMLHIAEERSESREVTIKDATSTAVAQIEAMHEGQGKCTGVETGFVDLDKLTGGLQKTDMILIAARPGQGKTSIAMNIVEHVAVTNGVPVGVFSMEMSTEALAMRLLCSNARVNLQDVRQGFMPEKIFPRLMTAVAKVGHAPIYIDDSSGISIGYLRSKARRMHRIHGIKLIVVDYIQLMKSGSKLVKSREQEIADVSMGIKALAKELKIPILVLAQLNREVEKREAGAKPKLSDLRECGGLEQDADVVGMLYRPKIGDKNSDGDADAPSNYDCVPMNLLIAKQRNGPQGEVHLSFLKGITKFENAAKVSADDYK